MPDRIWLAKDTEMPMPSASCEGVICSSMLVPSLHIANKASSANLCNLHNDNIFNGLYAANMAVSRPKRTVHWYFRQWAEAMNLRQVDMVRLTGWNKTTVSLLWNDRQDYTPAIVEGAAAAMNLRPFELLLPPDEAMAIRRMRESAVQLAADRRLDFIPEPQLDGTHG